VITTEATQSEYLLNVNNNQEKDKLNFGLSLLDLPLALETLSQPHQ
jgi:hypothetical protein